MKRTLEEAIIAGDREGRDNSGANRGRLEHLCKERDALKHPSGKVIVGPDGLQPNP